MDLLTEIVTHKKEEVARSKAAIKESSLTQSPLFRERTRSLKESLIASNHRGVIAEMKRRSPSGGVLSENMDPAVLALGYQKAGAVGVSVLTDARYFGGITSDLTAAKEACALPLLRKDFIIDEYQLIEARAYGADAVLLIARILESSLCRSLAECAGALGLEVLVEIHSEEELEGLPFEKIDILGVNNRDLDILTTDYRRSIDIAAHLPAEICRISESGISGPGIILELAKAGYNGFLIGEAFMKNASPQEACRDLISALKETA